MKSQDEEEHDDINTLLKKIKGIQAPGNESTGSVIAPPPEKKPGEGESDMSDAGDFSALIKKSGSPILQQLLRPNRKQPYLEMHFLILIKNPI